MKQIFLMFALIAMSGTAIANPLFNTTWQTGDGASHIKFTACTNGTPCGSIAWINPKNLPATERKNPLDWKNPKPSPRQRKRIGKLIMWGLQKKGTRWAGGKVYDLQDCKTYNAHVSLRPDGTQKVQTCIGPFCRIYARTKV